MISCKIIVVVVMIKKSCCFTTTVHHGEEDDVVSKVGQKEELRVDSFFLFSPPCIATPLATAVKRSERKLQQLAIGKSCEE